MDQGIKWRHDGVDLGLSPTDTISFHGATATGRRAGAAQAAVTPTAGSAVTGTAGAAVTTTVGAAVVGTATTQTTPFGFATQAQGDDLVARANQLRVDLLAEVALSTALRTDVAALTTLVNALRADSAAHTVLANEIRAMLVEKGLAKGAA